MSEPQDFRFEDASRSWHAFMSRKIVQAAEITGIVYDGKAIAQLTWKDPESGKEVVWVRPPMDIFARYQPKKGDYLVRYNDGPVPYFSVSPGATFENGYELLTDDSAELVEKTEGFKSVRQMKEEQAAALAASRQPENGQQAPAPEGEGEGDKADPTA